MNADLVRYIDSIHRDKGIDKEVLFVALEEALISAIKKRYEEVEEDFSLRFDRDTGELQSEYEINFEDLGRIFAQTVKQTWFTRIKEAERDVLFNEWEQKVGDIVTGTAQRFEGDSVVVNLGKIEGILPKTERVRGENYHVGDRLRALVLEVKKVGLKVKVILSRSSTGLVRRLFELEVPEIDDGIIEVKKLEREPGYRTKIAVTSSDARVDCVGACVGVRGTRIKSIIDELGGERIDIIRWNDDPKQMLINALQPADVSHIELDNGNHKALVLVEEDQLSLAIGRKGQNVRLASKLCGWDIDIMTRHELEETLRNDEAADRGEASEEAEPVAAEGADGSTEPAAAEAVDAGAASGAGEGEGEPTAAPSPSTAPEESEAANQEPQEGDQPAAADEPTEPPHEITSIDGDLAVNDDESKPSVAAGSEGAAEPSRQSEESV